MDAVLGRKLYYREMRQIIVAENINMAYKSRSKAQSWFMWEKENPRLAQLLIEATLFVEGNNDE